MFVLLILALLLSPVRALADPASTPDWSPFRAFIGTWEGNRVVSATGDPSPVRRTYLTGDGSRTLEVNERAHGSLSPWGTVTFDAALGRFVLQRSIAPDGVSELALDDISQDGARLTFVGSPTDETGKTERITHTRNGWNDFVETVETSSDGKQFSLVSETHFHRKG